MNIDWSIDIPTCCWDRWWDDYDLRTWDAVAWVDRTYGPSYRGTVFHPTPGDHSELDPPPATIEGEAKSADAADSSVALSEELMTFDISTAATKSSKPGLEALPVELMKSGHADKDWPKTYAPKHGKLVDEQEEFDASDEAVEMLKWTLQGFPNLKHSVSGNLRSLTLLNETVPMFLRYNQFPALTHVVIHNGNISSPLFKRFLFKHGKTLQGIDLRGLNLWGWYDDKDAFEPSDFEDIEDSDSDEDEVGQ
ncbi:hypothetical protein J4E91_008253 [Alternaria rosae]|nr:hypothetical protein J4E91_008253 [Alternaria rosae]